MFADDARDIAGGIDSRAVDAHKAVAGLQAGLVGRSALIDALHIHARLVYTILERCLRVVDAQHRDAHGRAAGNISVVDKLLGHLNGRVDRDREAQPFGILAAGLGVDDADQLAALVEQAAAGIAGADSRVRLQQVHGLILHGHLTVQRGDDAVRHGSAQLTQRVAHCQSEFAYLQTVGIAYDRRCKARGFNLQHGNIRFGIRAHDRSGILGAVARAHRHLAGAAHHMVVRDDVAVLGDDDAAARTALDVLTKERVGGNGLGGHLHHAGPYLAGDFCDGKRVGCVGRATRGAACAGRGRGRLINDGACGAALGEGVAQISAAEAHGAAEHHGGRSRGDALAPAAFFLCRMGRHRRAAHTHSGHSGGAGRALQGRFRLRCSRVLRISAGVVIIVKFGIVEFPIVVHKSTSSFFPDVAFSIGHGCERTIIRV